MKKLLSIFIVLLLLCSCKKNENKVNYTYDIVSKVVDMSSYDGVNSIDHMFKGITVDQLYNTIDNKSSAVFYLGRSNCECCQTCVKYLNEVAKDLGVTVYYIDVYDKDMPIESDEEILKLTNCLLPILAEVDGEKELQTPTVFSVINGELENSLICLANWTWDYPPKDSQINKLKNKYIQILKPFVEKNQD